MTGQYSDIFYDEQEQGSLESARILLSGFFDIFRPSSILDIGCGRGTWLRAAIELGVDRVFGIDGDYVNRKYLHIPPHCFQAVDLSINFDLQKRFDMAICLEVAEHLPYERSLSFIHDITKHSDLVMFSAAIPYQGGTDHINEQWPEFWAILFRKFGYIPYRLSDQSLAGTLEVEPWYSQNLVFFVKEGTHQNVFPESSKITNQVLSYVHPLIFLTNITRCRPYALSAHNDEVEDWKALVHAFRLGNCDELPQLNTVIRSQREGPSDTTFPSTRTITVDYLHETGALKSMISELEIEKGGLESVLESTRQKLEEQTLSTREIEKQLRAVYGSTSWKITSIPRNILGRMPYLSLIVRRSLKLIWWTISLQLLKRVRERYSKYGQEINDKGNCADDGQISRPMANECNFAEFANLHHGQNTLSIISAYFDDVSLRGFGTEIGSPYTCREKKAAVLQRGACIVRTQGNRLDLLSEAIDSVETQTIPLTPIIVVHGDSFAYDIVKRWLQSSSRNAIVLKAEAPGRRRGYPANIGLDYIGSHPTEFDFVCFLDDDDIFYPFFAERNVEAFAFLQADLIYSQSNNREAWREQAVGPGLLPPVCLLGGNFITINSFCVRVSSLLDADVRFDENMEYLEDWDFLISLLEKRLIFAPLFETLSEFRIFGDGNTRRWKHPSLFHECSRKTHQRCEGIARSMDANYFYRSLAAFPFANRPKLDTDEINIFNRSQLLFSALRTQ